jgi:anti-sigma-K factor RskA
MSETNHERWQEDVAAYMLGALEPERAQELERHAESCERCRAEIRWLTPALDALPESVVRQQPPPELRARLMAEVQADLGQGEPAVATDVAGSGVYGWLRSLVSGPMGWRPAAGLAAAALVIVAVIGFAVGGGLGEGGSGETDVYVAGEAPGVTAEVVTEDGGADLHLANVRELPEERVLEAWVQRDGEVEPVQALFVPDHEGNASTTIDDMDGVEVVMVTTEPPGGSESPTSSPMVTVPITS